MNPLGVAAGARMAGLASLLVIIPGVFLVLRRIRRTSVWSAAVAGIAVGSLLVPLAFYSNRAPLSSTALFVSLDIPAIIAVAGVIPRRGALWLGAWYVSWAFTGAILFTHGWFWG